jgi:hypothetical protein
MDRAIPKRAPSREGRSDSNRFLTYSRLHPRPLSNQRGSEENAKASEIDARLATVYDKMKSKIYLELAAYSEDVNPAITKNSQWRDTVKEITLDSQRYSQKPGGFTQVTELLSRFQLEIFEILKNAKKSDEVSLKARLWEVFNKLSNSLWSGFFKNRPEDLIMENKQLRSTLDQMEEEVFKLKAFQRDISQPTNRSFRTITAIK